MGNHDNSVALGVDAFKFLHDDMRRVGVEIASRLVGENNFGFRDDGAGDCGALLLTAGELIGHIVFFVF